MVPATENRLAVDLAHAVVPLTGGVRDDETLFGIIRDAPVVLVGESTHGTQDFYRARIEITKRLIVDRGFTAVCVEDDWLDADRVDHYVRGASDVGAIESLDGFARFPAWIWRNAEMLEFVRWLREYNGAAAGRGRPKVGFYGLDRYGTYASIGLALTYLDTVDSRAATRARRHFEGSRPIEIEGRPICRDEIVAELLEIRRKASRLVPMDYCVADAAEYYRALLDESVSPWSVRDAHAIDGLDRLMRRLESQSGPVKAVAWTQGALARRRLGDRAVSIGFTTYAGTVTAARAWHAPQERIDIVPARGDSYEYLFHSMNVPRFLLPLRPHRPKLHGLPQEARARAIGVIYLPQPDPAEHFVTECLIDGFDAIYHFDATRALEQF